MHIMNGPKQGGRQRHVQSYDKQIAQVVESQVSLLASSVEAPKVNSDPR
jgi:hypothetical protein